MPAFIFSLKSKIYVLIIVAIGTGIFSMIFTESMKKHDDMASPPNYHTIRKFHKQSITTLSNINIWDHLSKMVPSAPINFMQDQEKKGQQSATPMCAFPKTLGNICCKPSLAAAET